MMTGNATPAQVAGLLMALRVRGETVEEITAGADSLRERMVKDRGTGGCDRHLRHRRRRRRAPTTSRPRRRSWWPVPACRWPSTATAACPRKSGSAEVLTAARRQHRRRVPAGRAGDPRGRDRLHDGAAPSWRHAPRRRPARRAGHPHDLQPAGPAGEPGRRRPPADGRVRGRSGSSPWPRCWAGWARSFAWVVHGSDGLDELTTTGPTHVARMGRQPGCGASR